MVEACISIEVDIQREIANFVKNLPYKNSFQWKMQPAQKEIVAIGINIIIGVRLWKIISSIIVKKIVQEMTTKIANDQFF
jgi:hypothetical protein